MKWQKKYSWRLTWPGEGHEDWSCFDGDLYVGRIMRDLTTYGKQGHFMWTGGVRGRAFQRDVMPNRGWKAEHWEAAKAVEDWYDRLREVNGMEPR